MSSTFDPDTFLAQTVTEANDTKIVPCPVGEFTGIIKEYKARQWTAKNDPSNQGVTLDITWSIDDQGVKEALDRTEVTVRQGIMLDVLDSGGLDLGKGKNVGLGRLREAVGLNVPGQPFAFPMLTGQVAKLTISHRVVGEDIFADVKMVAKLG